MDENVRFFFGMMPYVAALFVIFVCADFALRIRR